MPQHRAISLRSKVVVWISVLILLLPWPAQSQKAELQQLVRKSLELQDQGSYKQATILAVQALSLAEKSRGAEHPTVASILNILASLYVHQGNYAHAEPLYQRAQVIVEKSLGAEHSLMASILNNLGSLNVYLGQFGRAEPLHKRALAIREKSLGVEHPDVASSLSDLAQLYRIQGQYAQAEPLCRRALAIREKALGPNHPAVAVSLKNLGNLLMSKGQYAQAEPLNKRALAIQEKFHGADHPAVASSLDGLASLYAIQGQYALAEPLHKRALAIREKYLGADHPAVANSLDSLALLYRDQGRHAAAEPLSGRALAIRAKALGASHIDVAASVNSLALLQASQGKYALAESMHKRALEFAEKAVGEEHPNVATSLGNLANMYHVQGQYAQAEPLYERALAIREKSLGAGSPQVAESLSNLALLYENRREYSKALGLIRRASAIYRQRIAAAGVNDLVNREAYVGQKGLFRHLSLLARNPDKDPPAKLTDEALQIVQLAQSSGTASAIAKMAARFASGSDALAQLAKRKQDAAVRRTTVETELVKAFTQPSEKRDGASEQRLRDAATQIAKELESIDSALTRRFPAYQELARPEPVTIARIQSLLHPREAMLVYALGSSSYVWVVTPEKASFRALPVKAKEVGAHVSKLRSQMEFDDNGRAPKVSVDVLHELYNKLFAPILSELSGASHVMVVPSGPLQSLPLGMLVSMPPTEIKTDADYRNVQWLVRSYAFSVLPSVSSIQAFRQFVKTERAQEPFAGFGDPLIGKGTSPQRGVRAKLDVAQMFRSVAANQNGFAGTPGAEIADVEFIRRATRLPETADELRSMAKTLKADPQSVWLQAQATETRVKAMDLSHYRILAFATHGALAGEVKGAGEPGLVLTPPAAGSLEDDGYLSASEIAKLNLNADWVVLSACNTAAADGTPGAEGLSGMAKAFFYAGARSLLVSHWPVASGATVPLTTVMLQEFESNPKLGKAQAQRKAMLALINTPDHPEYAHPLFWAPFVVVGEGGPGLRVK